MKILYATSEAVPFCKTGGLADVAGSLPPALAQQNAEVAVILPLYRRVRDQFGDQLRFECFDFVDLGWRHCYCGLFSVEKDGVTWYFVDNEQYFSRPDLYGYDDDNERFAFFSRAVVRMLHHLKFWPDVIHCNDWQTALIPIYLKDDGVREDYFRSIKTVLTIHNIEYQGRCGTDALGNIFGLNYGWAADGTIMMDGDVNLLKGAILCADAINAVSPTYASELKLAYFAHRLEGIMSQCDYKLSGVLNGIDMKLYDPATDSRIAKNYSVDDMSGKAENKANLQRMMGLREDPNVPIVAIVSRLVSHKGLDLICEVLHDMMELPLQMVVLGKGDRTFEEFFDWAAQQYRGRMAVRLDYNEALSMAIYAGADLFLMPSKSEPCGLSQMIAMRYGTVPIVRETGGLKDTVHAYEAWRDSGNGFSFANYSSSDMLHVINDAVFLYKDYPDAFARLRRRAMECDFSWARSAKDYLRIYATITGQSWPVEESVPFEAAPAAEAAEAVEKAAPEAEAAAETVPAEEAAAPVEEAPKKRVRKKAPVAAEAAAAAEEAPKKRVRKKVPVAAEAAAAAEEAPKKRVKKTAAKKAEGEEKKPARKTVKKAAGKTAAKTEE
ncbi:MAG: glycogen synthase GlgA [Oscillospiraceae bacterium]|nr:glycogen synthase GlgA [Oscillospiraceae bacterium]